MPPPMWESDRAEGPPPVGVGKQGPMPSTTFFPRQHVTLARSASPCALDCPPGSGGGAAPPFPCFRLSSPLSSDRVGSLDETFTSPFGGARSFLEPSLFPGGGSTHAQRLGKTSRAQQQSTLLNACGAGRSGTGLRVALIARADNFRWAEIHKRMSSC